MSVSSSLGGRVIVDNTAPDVARNGDRPLTILQVVPRLDMGGVERGTLEMTEAIIRAEGRALVATRGGTLEGRITRAGGELVHMAADSKNPFTIRRNADYLADVIRQAGVDVIHARSRAPAWSAYWAAKATGCAFVTTYHGVYNEDFPFKRRYNAIMARGRPVIAVSHFIRDLVHERHAVPYEQIEVIPRGADISVFSEEMVGNQRAIKLAEDWALIDDTRPVVMLPGRLTRWKGAESLIDAAARLKEMRGGPDFLILIVGDDGGSGFADTLNRRIASTGTGDCVYLVGPTTDMAAAYKLASVVVSASIEPEAFGRVVVEAQAMGRPVIATDHGGARETVAHGESGWLYPPGDIEKFADVLNRALSLDPSERAHMGLAARVRVHAAFSIEAMQRATLTVYERAAGRLFAQR